MSTLLRSFRAAKSEKSGDAAAPVLVRKFWSCVLVGRAKTNVWKRWCRNSQPPADWVFFCQDVPFAESSGSITWPPSDRKQLISQGYQCKHNMDHQLDDVCVADPVVWWYNCLETSYCSSNLQLTTKRFLCTPARTGQCIWAIMWSAFTGVLFWTWIKTDTEPKRSCGQRSY